MKILDYKNLKLSEIKKYQEIDAETLKKVSLIIEEVRKRGDAALFKFSNIYDRCRIDRLKIDPNKEGPSDQIVREAFKNALNIAFNNIKQVAKKQFQALQVANGIKIQSDQGIVIRQKLIPINRVGIYVPSGRYPLFSSLYMAAIPAKVSGVKEIVVCTPPNARGKIQDEIIYVANKLGLKELYAVGGAQAIAAMAYGTETIKPVDKIVGPGNIYVAAAKKLVFGRVGIDFLAGPTELLIIADDTAQPEKVAADLLAQAEHDVLARSMLITFSKSMAEKVREALRKQLCKLPTAAVATKSIQKNGLIIICQHAQEAADLANEIAPEHLSLFLKYPQRFINELHNYGCLFIGESSAEVFGDYCAGTNHILPTNGAAKYTGGLSVVDFLKFTTSLEIMNTGADKIIKPTIILAKREGLTGHAKSAECRSSQHSKNPK